MSIIINGRPLVEEWNVGQGTYCESRWSVGDKLQKGENTIEWRAGKLRTHYWLRKAEVGVAFDSPVAVQFSVPKVEHALLWEGRFDQCSYNALATVLDHFYGVEGWNNDRKSYERRVFVSALDKFGLGAYYGWAPWTSYMAQAGTICWNGHPVTNLKAERFSLRPKAVPRPQGQEMIVQYEPGEKAKLVQKLRSRLEKGPVIIWTPYAAATGGGEPWRHVRAVEHGHRCRPVQPQHDAQRRGQSGGGEAQGLRQLLAVGRVGSGTRDRCGDGSGYGRLSTSGKKDREESTWQEFRRRRERRVQRRVLEGVTCITMNDAFEKRVRAAAVAGWWTLLIAVAFITLRWICYAGNRWMGIPFVLPLPQTA